MFLDQSFPTNTAIELARPTLITPVILAGGIGTRLWPVSTETMPKQFSILLDGKSLFQHTLARLNKDGFAAPIVIGAKAHYDVLRAQSKEHDASIILEPIAKNTAASVLIAALCSQEENPDDMLLICPSDHKIDTLDAFYSALSSGITKAQNGAIVTFGITPTHAATGYGYITPSGGFIEKPTQSLAKRLISRGASWNSGLFLATSETIIQQFKTLQPRMFETVKAAWDARHSGDAHDILSQDIWKELANISFDHAIMMQCKNIDCISFDAGWRDLGDWSQADHLCPNDNAYMIDCKDTALKTTHPNQQLVGLGLNNITAIATQNAILICDNSRLQDVKRIAQIVPQTQAILDHRPWGQFERLSNGDRYQVKKITVDPNQVLSLQSHHHRAEHWIVVKGTAKVTRGQDEFLLTENQSTYIPLGETHRLENPGKIPLELIEVQTGCYLGEDDIIRYEDRYNRP